MNSLCSRLVALLFGLPTWLVAAAPAVTPADLQRVYDEVRTPYKYGVVIQPTEGELVDCPSVFRYADHWYMVYVANRDQVGYQTLLAESPDLLHWKTLGTILPFARTGWDAWQADGGISLVDPTWGGSAAPESYDGKYWISYIGGAAHGYEPDPLAIGLAWAAAPNQFTPWIRLPGNPVLSPAQSDVRPFEAVTLYKSTIVRDPTETLGAPFVMFYNGKRELPAAPGKRPASHESIGMAVSHDMVHWTRFGAEPVVDNAPGKPAISGDPQIVRLGDLWVMFYFGFRWRPHAFDTFAVSRDLVHWTRWEGPNLVEPSVPWDSTFAHKPWVLKHDGIVYHFYCAVSKSGRTIALATSRDLRPAGQVTVTAPAVVPAEIWVAPGGDDHNPGTKDRPLGSIAQAQRAIRELRRLNDPAIKAGARIILRGGTYFLPETLRLRWEDSGTESSPTIIESADGEHAVISGGVRIAGWEDLGATSRRDQRIEQNRGPEPLSPLDPVLARIPAAARGHLWIADAPRIGDAPLRFRELWVNGRKATRARTPDDPQMARLIGWDRANQIAAIPSSIAGALATSGGVEMVLEQQWEIAILRLKSLAVSGAEAQVTFESPESAIEFQHPWPQPMLPPKGGGAFFLVNAPEFLDSPGEWYEDAMTGRVYYWPRGGEDLTRSEVVAPVTTQLVEIEATLDRPVQYVDFRWVGFAYSAWNEPGRRGHVPLQAGMPLVEAYKLAPPGTPDKAGLENQAWIRRVPAAVSAAAADHIGFEHCRFEHLGASALDLRRGVHDSSVTDCVFRDIGVNGIQVGSFQEGGVETHVPYLPADDRVVCARIRISNNVLRDTANVDWGGVAIVSGYAREVVIEHNDIANTSYTGISVGWGWTRVNNASRENRVHANLLRNVATRLCDTAAIYTLSVQPGTLVDDNVIDDIVMSPYVDRPQHWFYLYSDEGTSYIAVRDNWCPAERFLQNANGPGNVWENNGPMVSAQIKRRAGLEPGHGHGE